MFRIRRVYDDITPANQHAIAEVTRILKDQFPALSRRDVAKLPDQLRNPLKHQFRAILFVAEGSKDRIDGFALLFHAPSLKFCYLDYLSASKQMTGGGIGGALYERVREEALDLEAVGLFYECLPDEPELSRDPVIRKQNMARLRFYERYGARPIINTAYETPLKPGNDNPPYLVFDDLGQDIELSNSEAKDIVRAILERKYRYIVTRAYAEMVLDSITDDPIQLRKPKYVKRAKRQVKREIPDDEKVRLVVNDRHWIHHVEERGYVEAPVRIDVILEEINKTNYFQRIPVRHYSEKNIKAVHDHGFVDYLREVCTKLGENEAVYPYVFPIRNRTRPPIDLPIRAGYYCIDTFTPLTGNAFFAAERAVDCCITAARQLLQGYRIAYALVRPPGHHAEYDSFGGFCYFNSASVAANVLSSYGRVAMLDIDYHHGNGQQDIFYTRKDVLTISIHGHPSFAYPYFSGFSEEKGEEEGKGYNRNYPLPETITNNRYHETLRKAVNRVKRFHPDYLVVPTGLDTAKEDPTGSWTLDADDFEEIGRTIGCLHIPTLVVQEGGYDTRVLGTNVASLFKGLWTTAHKGF